MQRLGTIAKAMRADLGLSIGIHKERDHRFRKESALTIQCGPHQAGASVLKKIQTQNSLWKAKQGIGTSRMAG